MVKVTDIKITDIGPKFKDPAIVKLLPTKFRPQHMEFIISDVNVAIANGIRRVILSELPARALTFELSTLDTNDDFILNDMLLERIRQIPIDQTTPLTATFTLNVINNTESTLEVKSSELTGGKLPCNETFVIVKLEPTKYIKISKITVDTGYEYLKKGAGYNIACNAACITMDQVPINHFLTDEENAKLGAISCSVSNPRQHKITFNTNGTKNMKEIVYEACENIQVRLRNIILMLDSIYSTNNIYHLLIKGESDTIGNILMKTITELYVDIDACTYSVDHIGRNITLKIRTDDDVADIIKSAVNKCVKELDLIKKDFT